jgi:HD-GYP domain-containing protein (c-di-GMP phosphodiesterase class II)
MIAEQEIVALSAGLADAATERHAYRVGTTAWHIGLRLGLAEDDLEALYLGSIIHDIGKIGVSESILNKTGPLDFEEWTRMEKHPVIGESMVAPISSGSKVLPIIRHHHERFDGHGYPDGLRGDRIPLLARIVSICDAYDALVNDRPYRPRVPEPAAVAILREGAGRQWDPELVEVFVNEISVIARSATA